MRTCKAPRGLAIDTVAPLDEELCKGLYGMGVRLVFGYVDRVVGGKGPWEGSVMTPERLAMILDAGLCFSPAQFFSTAYESQAKGARLSAAYGGEMGRVAATNVKALGIPTGEAVAVWRDLEDVEKATPAMARADLIGWGAAAVTTGLEADLYYGSGLGSAETGYLTGEMLYSLPYYRSYWRAASAVPQIPTRGNSVVQSSQVEIVVPCVRGDKIVERRLTVDFDLVALDHCYQSDMRRGHPAPGRFVVVCA